MRKLLQEGFHGAGPRRLGQESQFVEVFLYLLFGLFFLNHRHQHCFFIRLYDMSFKGQSRCVLRKTN